MVRGEITVAANPLRIVRDSVQLAWLFTVWCGLLSVPTGRSGRIVCRPSPSATHVRPLLQCVVLFRARTAMYRPRSGGLLPVTHCQWRNPSLIGGTISPQLVLPLMLPMMRTSFTLLAGASLKSPLLAGLQASLTLSSPTLSFVGHSLIASIRQLDLTDCLTLCSR